MKKLRVRSVIELAGLVALSFGVWHEKSLIVSSWQTIKNSNAKLVIACFALAWLNYLWSGLGYKFLAPKIDLFKMCLVNLASSGPGRVIPGGAGYLSFGILFLRKQAIQTQKAVAIAVVNNLLGFLVNALVLCFIFILNPSLLNKLGIASLRLDVLLVAVAVVLLIVLIINHNERAKKSTIKAKQELYALGIQIVKHPGQFAALAVVMLATIVTNSTILLLAGHAVNMPIAFDQAILVMSVGVGVGSLLPTPGGVGGVEAGLLAALLVLGFDKTAAGGTVLIYRAATYLQPFIPGFVSYIYLRKKKLL